MQVSVSDPQQSSRIDEFVDHRALGLQQELFFFDSSSPGAALFLPHGARIANTLMNFLREEYRKRGYAEIITPMIFSNKLWECQSQNSEWFAKNLFTFNATSHAAEDAKKKVGAFPADASSDDSPVAKSLKPINCPAHCLVFAHCARSHQNLPLRFADFGVLHRNEPEGVLFGLSRLRKFQQDDAHIFCREDQVAAEVKSVLEFLQHVYCIFGFKFSLILNTCPKERHPRIASIEDQLKQALDVSGHPWSCNPGGGDHHGPRIDVRIADARNRWHLGGTIQVDAQLPLDFKLNFTTPDGKTAVPILIHRAILGSVEGIMAIMLEQTAGMWPLWLSPRQVLVVPDSARADSDYAQEVHDQLQRAGFFVDIDFSVEPTQKKINRALYNVVVFVGQQERASGSVRVRHRQRSAIASQPIAALVADLRALVSQFK